MASSSEDPEPSSASDLGPDAERLEEKTLLRSMHRMRKDGLSAKKIGKYFGLSSDDVTARLNQHQESSELQVFAKPEPEVGDDIQEEAKRLLTDPEDLLCPIGKTLMEHPFVAQDGYTYEKNAIEEALRNKRCSPITNQPMGNQVVPNHDKKSAIVTYMETTVRKAVELAKSVPADIAEALLLKAEGFVRSKPPDSAARVNLLKLLQLRAALPSESRRETVEQLMSLVAEDPAKSVEEVAELLANFESWDVASHLCDRNKFDQEFVMFLQTSAHGPPVLPCAEMLEKELASRLAEALERERERALAAAKPKMPALVGHKTQTGGVVPSLEPVAGKLWEFVFCLSSVQASGIWVDGAALVLAALHTKLQVDLPNLSDEILSKALHFLKKREDACARAVELFRSDLCMASETKDSKTFRAELLMLLFKRHPEDGLALLSSFVADFDHEAQDNLLNILLQNVPEKGPVECTCQPALLKLLYARREQVPDELLPKLSLEPGHIQLLAPETSVALAQQLLMAERPAEGSRIAVIAAKAFESLGSTEKSERAFTLAYDMDHGNAEAAEGMLNVLLGHLEKKGQIEQERLLLTLLFEFKRRVPDHLLACLALEPREIRQLPPGASLALAEQLSDSKRHQEGAQLAVLAAEAFEASGLQEEADSAYARAHSMDRLNVDASNGLLSATSRSCRGLTALVKEQQATIDQLRKCTEQLVKEVEGLRNHVQSREGRGIIWDLSDEDLVEGFCKESPKINLENGSESKHVQAWICCRANGRGSSPTAAIFLQCNESCKIDCEISVDGKTETLSIESTEDYKTKFPFPSGLLEEKLGKISLRIKALKLEGGTVQYDY
ncbi:PUB53 [Symbiodinium sp. CCMP2592]|nr:PUB53 [Symbiodinium sp. CCMP2592]